MPHALSLGRTVAIATMLIGSVLVVSPTHAAEDPSLDAAVADVLGPVTDALPLTIGVTTRGVNGPEISSTVVDTLDEAADLIRTAQASDDTMAVGVAHPVTIEARDTFRTEQWALSTFKSKKVWKKATGGGVVVAVIDTGVKRKHPDLKGRVLRGIDLVDRGTSSADANGHGTHVAGIIGAIARNGQGIAGLAHGAKILPVRVLDASGGGSTVDVAEGIVWAVNNGADVINLSLGSTGNDGNLRAAVAYAVSKNVVVLAAAGNDGCNILFGSPTTYPASYPNVVGVGSINSNRSVSSFSNCGSWVDVVAPGGGIISTMLKNSDSSLGCRQGELYCYLSGTSMATPYAAAAAALSIETAGRGWRASTVRRLLESTANDLGSSGKDRDYGSGLVNPRRLISQS